VEATPSEKLLVGYRGPAIGDADHVAMCVLSEVLFGGRSGRVIRALTVDRELATDVRGWVSTFRDPGLFETYLTARPGVTGDELLGALESEFDRVQTELIRPEELARAKARLEFGLVASLETAAGKAEQIGFYDTVMGDPVGAMRRLAAYERVERSQVRYVARKYLVRESRTVVRVLPDEAKAAS
jgi:zinc protease